MRLVIAPGIYVVGTNVIIDAFQCRILTAFMNEKMIFLSYRNNDIRCTHARGHATLREFNKKMQFDTSSLPFRSDYVLKLVFFN